jgi:threonylcarbamoyladenosine tRNA methylthiotransferase MtaB
MRIYVGSLGCKLNQSEMDTLASQLAGAGHQIVSTPEEASLCVLNTCAVTHVAAQKTRQALRRMNRENPGARLVVTGCYAELTPTDLQDLPGVELVAGNQTKDHLATLIDPLQPAAEPHSLVPSLQPPAPSPRTRALVKIQDGCDNACTYCIIHVARGAQRSHSPDHVLAEVQARLDAGHREVVLTGVHIGAYGRDRAGDGPGPDLWGLVARILAETSVPRLRLSSIEPWDLPQRALGLWEEPRLCRHLHLPLQSGSDTILRRMARRCGTSEFAAIVEAARAAIPGLALTTDVIVGFPGETEDESAESLKFARRMGFARIHVFPYSLRPGTPAADMPGQVPAPVKRERAKAMRAVASASDLAFRQQFIGQTVKVLWESSISGEPEPVWRGLTDNYLRVEMASTAELSNQETEIRLVSLTENGLRGQIEI